MFIFLLFVVTEAITVRTNIPKTPRNNTNNQNTTHNIHKRIIRACGTTARQSS